MEKPNLKRKFLFYDPDINKAYKKHIDESKCKFDISVLHAINDPTPFVPIPKVDFNIDDECSCAKCTIYKSINNDTLI